MVNPVDYKIRRNSLKDKQQDTPKVIAWDAIGTVEATRMTDHYTSPLGLLGKLADYLFLKQYMTHLLLERKRVVKEVAESGKWQEILAMEKRVVL